MRMLYKIAVGSRDGKTVTEHFGGCGRFVILEVDSDAGSWAFAGFRPVTPACGDGGHTDGGLDAMAEVLSDCRLVLIAKIGPPAELALRERGIDVIEYHGFIEDAMRRILQYYK